MKNTIYIENLRGIKSLLFEIPSKGVYLLTGPNGCGKTTLLISLDRIGNSEAFRRFKVGRKVNMDTFVDSRITYSHDADVIVYHRTPERWRPNENKNFKGLQLMYGYNSAKFLTTTGARFYQSEPDELYSKGATVSFTNVPDFIKNGLNEILDTRKFDNLKYVQVKKKRGKQKVLHRDNKLYAIVAPDGKVYSELNFSLGERLLLNTLEFIQDISDKALLLIDEIELALHPTAQVRFLRFVEQITKTKKLTCIISSHSSTLIKLASKRIYLENNDGVVTPITNCQPSYILQDMTFQEDYTPDHVFFVEDIMARKYLSTMVNILLKEANKHINVKVVPVGGYPELIKFTANSMKIPPFSKKNVHAFPDADVRQSIAELRHDHEEGATKLISIFDSISDNITYLDVTPDPALWTWIITNVDKYKSEIEQMYGLPSVNIQNLIDYAKAEHTALNIPGREIDYAKACIKTFRVKYAESDVDMNEDKILDAMFSAYIKGLFEDREYKNQKKRQIFKILGS